MHAQEIHFDIGINKVGYTPLYRTVSEKYQPSFQADMAWQIVGQNRHQFLVGAWLQWNLQNVLGNQLNMGPLLNYRVRIANSFFAELQTGYGFQLLFPIRTLYEQTQDGSWQPSNQLLTNHVVPLRIGVGKRFGRHSIQLNYGYQMIFGFNSSISTLPVDGWSIGYGYQIKQIP